MFVRRVAGTSMLPAVQPGTWVVARRKPAAPGDIVIARQNGRDVIKRVQAASPGGLFLVGDNGSESTDSRTLGSVPKTDILGVVTMKLFAPKALPAPKMQRKELWPVPYVFAVAVTGMLLLQLFEFENFVPLMQSITGNDTAGRLLAANIAGVELFSLPFLLRLQLSPLARLASGCLSVLLPLVWLVLIILRPAGNIGLLGTKVAIESGVVNLAAAVLLSVLSIASFYILGGRSLIKGLKRH